MPEPLLAILKLCALALVYLFFLRVLRAVWAELLPVRQQAPVAVPPRARPARRATRARARGGAGLVVIEPAELEGTRHDLGDEVTLGRAAGCTVTLDDHYVSQVHARFTRRDGEVYVEDLGSTNGTYVNGEKLTGSALVKRGDHVRIGSTVLEVHP